MKKTLQGLLLFFITIVIYSSATANPAFYNVKDYGANPHCSYIGGEGRECCISFFLSSSLCTTDFLLVKGFGFSSRMD
jgi:hypothetical protein